MADSAPSVLVVGDVMLDRYIHGDMQRISAESPAPVVRVREVVGCPGGAANVAVNIASLGARVLLAGVVGEDAAAKQLEVRVQDAGVPAALVGARGQATTIKTRVMVEGRQVLRLDDECPPLSAPGELCRAISGALADPLANVKLIVVSDYGKGAMAHDVVELVMREGRQRRLPIFVDARPAAAGAYIGASLYKPNLREALALVTIALSEVHPVLATDDLFGKAEIAARRLQQWGFGAVVITLGEHGACYCSSPESLSFSAGVARAVFDLTGAGDTFMAALAVASLEGQSLPQAVAFANAAAGLAVQSSGTRRVTRAAVNADMRTQGGWAGKIIAPEQAYAIVLELQAQHKQVVLTNGCFDCLHAGHIEMLRAARSCGDYLLVAHNDDVSLRSLKGEGRPIVTEGHRAAHLAQLACVDAVFRFDGDAGKLVRQIRPEVYVKGRDTLLAGQVPEADYVASYGGRVEFVPEVYRVHSSDPEKSTGNLA